MTVLILNHSTQNCGVYQFGKRVADLAVQSTSVNFIYKEINNPDEYKDCLAIYKPTHILYNWYPITMNWLKDDLDHSIKHYFIYHDGHYRKNNVDKFLFFGAAGVKNGSLKDFPLEKQVVLPRPLLNYTGVYRENNILNIGSFGFGFHHKGFPDIVRYVNENFDQAILNLHIPNGHFGDPSGITAKEVIDYCKKENTSSGIQLNITSNLLTNYELLEFLAGNDINLFMYFTVNEGLSSVVDYALSVKRPIAINDNMMFRHIPEPDIRISKNNSILDILDRGTKPLEQYYEKWSINNFIKQISEVFSE